jgi:hypothetical protein
MSRYRTIIAFLVAPLSIPILLSAGLTALDYADKNPSASFVGFLEGIVFFSIFALPQAYISELLFGLPAWFFFRSNDMRAWPAFVVGGAMLGAGYDFAYNVARSIAEQGFAYDFVNHAWTRNLNPLGMEFAIPAGLVAAISFRAIVFPRQSPDKSNNPPIS